MSTTIWCVVILENKIFPLRDLTVTLGSGQPQLDPLTSGLVRLGGSLPLASPLSPLPCSNTAPSKWTNWSAARRETGELVPPQMLWLPQNSSSIQKPVTFYVGRPTASPSPTIMDTSHWTLTSSAARSQDCPPSSGSPKDPRVRWHASS